MKNITILTHRVSGEFTAVSNDEINAKDEFTHGMTNQRTMIAWAVESIQESRQEVGKYKDESQRRIFTRFTAVRLN